MNVIKLDVALCFLCLLFLTPSCKVEKATPIEDIMEQEEVVANTIDTVSVNWNEETFHFEIQIGDDYFEEVSGIESVGYSSRVNRISKDTFKIYGSHGTLLYMNPR